MTDAETTRIWAQLDKIGGAIDKLQDSVAALTAEVHATREASEARLKRLEEDSEHAKASRGKAFERMEKISERVTELELAPARQALQDKQGDRKTIRTEVIRRLTALGIGIILVITATFGAGVVVKQYGAIAAAGVTK